MNIQDAKILVTGGTSGIGYATAKLLKNSGATVVICGRHEEKVQQAAAALGVYGFKADVTVEADVVKLFEFAVVQMNGLNVLVNNAGIGQFAALTKTTVEMLTQMWEVNVKGLFVAGKAAADYFMQQKAGNIINIGSTAALNGYANGSAYVASKFAVTGLTQCWRAELRPYNIRVMQVNPSEVITDFITKAGFEKSNEAHKLKPEQVAHVIKSMLTMDEIGFIPDASVWATNSWGK